VIIRKAVFANVLLVEQKNAIVTVKKKNVYACVCNPRLLILTCIKLKILSSLLIISLICEMVTLQVNKICLKSYLNQNGTKPNRI